LTVNYINLQKVLLDLQDYKLAKLLIVTKNQSLNDIRDLMNKGYNIFGENKVQEAKKKFHEVNNLFKINLHLIGQLQTNKVKDALHLFNTQINIGSEDQKSGIDKFECKDFYQYALAKDLNIEGLMCIPPNTSNTHEYFQEMNEIRKNTNPNLKLSMGMSNDYQIALEHQSNLIRIGSFIFHE
jgi:uncharacterized pyridoxal phosphate-containing UPF0001 family protein